MPRNDEDKTLNYLALVASKYNVKTEALLNCISEAWVREKSRCKRLVVTCREKHKNSAIFLLTSDQKIVAQLSISDRILEARERAARHIEQLISNDRFSTFKRSKEKYYYR